MYEPWLMPQNRRWILQAACQNADPELFFSNSLREETIALRLCATCPVRQACLDAALAEESSTASSGRYGIRGGLKPFERHLETVRHSNTSPEGQLF